MLASDDPGFRSFRSVRSFLSTLNSTQAPDLESSSVKAVKFLHLSPSLNPGLISMGLWSWIHSQDSNMRQELLDRIQFKNEVALSKANQTRLFSSTGEQIKFPEHLLSCKETAKDDLKESKSAMNRKLVHDLYNISIEEYTKTNRRFFLQIVDACLKSNTFEHVIFTIKCSYQQQISVRHLLVKEGTKGFGFFVHASDGFLFDVNDDKVSVSITMHAYDSGSSRGNLVRKPSFLMFRSQSKKQDQVKMGSNAGTEPIAFVPHPSLLGQVLGEVHFTLPPYSKNFKTSGTYTLSNGKKEVAKMFLKMGFYDDVQIIQSDIEKKIAKIPEVPEFSDFLNVLNDSNMLWKKYWVVYRDYALHFFDFEYKEDKEELESLNILSVESVQHPDPSLFCYSNSLQLQLSKHALAENEWIQSLVCDSELPVIYVSADSKSKRDEWFNKLSTLVTEKTIEKSKPAKEKSRVGHPQLPPRK